MCILLTHCVIITHFSSHSFTSCFIFTQPAGNEYWKKQGDLTIINGEKFMNGNNVLSVVVTIIIYSFLGFLVIALFFSVFPFLAIILLVILGFYAVTSIVNRLRTGIGQAQTKKKFDEYGNRRTNATVISMEEADGDKKVTAPVKDKTETENKDEKK